MNQLNPILGAFFDGVYTCGYLIASTFFLRFWNRSHDQLFLWFCLAFFFLASSSAFPVILGTLNDQQPAVYLLRLAGYIAIILAILKKNTERGPRP